jgi:hypothetical protein
MNINTLCSIINNVLCKPARVKFTPLLFLIMKRHSAFLPVLKDPSSSPFVYFNCFLFSASIQLRVFRTHQRFSANPHDPPVAVGPDWAKFRVFGRIFYYWAISFTLGIFTENYRSTYLGKVFELAFP